MGLIILAYITGGILLNLFLDIIVDILEKESIVDGDSVRFDIFSKMLLTLFWPFALIMLVYSMFKNPNK